ncbi:hypothetical protein JHL21_02660 [Devosia sp. WQ 349]|uniref:hypothetical protein n=1 Tax=Devosia sp. WQ 349K1 TaxID=2800329 RepID=UPI00190583C0|nr:hypothetical protein [Devosia sp. WQ 349K1]MBK1793398.1 hypothetical protein [Devosia sp. WQ 349K1]
MGIKPILFSAPMVRSLLDGTKTQTRRVIKPQPSDYQGNPNPPRGQSWVNKTRDEPYIALHDDQVHWCWWDEYNQQGPDWFKLPIAKGDTLWVRETWTARMTHGWTIADARSRMYQEEIFYRADNVEAIDGWWPSIHMPREFSRIALKVAGVKVQRLQDISEEDAIAEGMTLATADAVLNPEERVLYATTHIFSPNDRARFLYAAVWDLINGPGSWDANPFVAAYTFTVHRGNVDALNGAAA